jgi:hypothetical protein
LNVNNVVGFGKQRSNNKTKKPNSAPNVTLVSGHTPFDKPPLIAKTYSALVEETVLWIKETSEIPLGAGVIVNRPACTMSLETTNNS